MAERLAELKIEDNAVSNPLITLTLPAGRGRIEYYPKCPISLGALSHVYKGVLYNAQGDPQIVALKVINPYLSADTLTREQLWDEFLYLRAFEQESIQPSQPRTPKALELVEWQPQVNPQEIHTPSTILAIVMEYIPGENLDHIGKVDVKEALSIMDQLLTIVADAEEPNEATRRDGLVLCDIKPKNIMYDRETGLIHLIDFGLATQLREVPMLHRGKTWGSLGYFAPEQIQFFDENDTRQHVLPDATTNQYQLAIVLYELLTGKKLIKLLDEKGYRTIPEIIHITQEGGCQNEMMRDLDSTQLMPLLEVFRRATMFYQEDRYISTREMQSALKAAAKILAEN